MARNSMGGLAASRRTRGRRRPVPRVEALEDRQLLALTWTGAAATNGWADGTVGTLTNWDTQTIPADGDTLIFPTGALQLSNLNNTADGTGYGLSLTGGGYTLDGALVTLTAAGLSDTATADTNTIALGLASSETSLPMDVAASGHTLRLTGSLMLSGTARKTGDGTLLLIGSAVVPVFDVQQGVLGVGAGVQLDSVNINGGTLAGVGSVNTVDVGAAPGGGTLAPGLAGPGVLTAGSLHLPGITFAAELNGPAAGTGYDQVVSLGPVDINGTALQLTLGAVPTPGQSFTIVDNQGFDPINGTFNGLPNGALFDVGGVTLRISYDGGDGNDVVVRATGRPIAAPDLYALPGEATFTLFQPTDGVLANDSGPNGLPLQALLASGPSHGTLALNGDGTFSYTPSPGFSGADSFTYTAADARGVSDPVTVTLVVNAVANAPVGTDDAYTLNEDTDLTAAPSVLTNDVGPAGTPLTAALVTAPVNAQAFQLNADGTFDYTPAADFNGTDTFRYRPVAGNLSGTMVTVTLTVNPVADAPTPVADAFTMAEDGTLFVGTPGVLANDANPDAALLTAVVANGPGHGSLVLASDGSFTYTPDANFNGVDTFTYRAVNGPTPSAGVATVTITVTAVNDPPIARDDLAATKQGQAVAVAVLANDSDPDGDALSAVLVNTPLYGAAVVNADGTITYTPAAGFHGTDTFTYRASDGVATSEIATVTVIVDAVNTAPTSQDDTFTMVEGQVLTVAAPGVLANDSDPDGDAMTAVLAAAPSNGTLALNGNGSFIYTPNANFSGSDSFTYHASDGQAIGNLATVTITVGSRPSAPTANDDAFTLLEDVPLEIPAPGILANDVIPDGGPVTITVLAGPLHGAVEMTASDGSFRYTPSADFNGSDSFTYFITGASLRSGVATVRLTVLPVADPPVGTPDDYTTNEGVPLLVAGPGVLVNDGNPDGGALGALLSVGPEHGSVVLNADGSFSYTPEAHFNGVDHFSYLPRAAGQAGAATLATIVVRPVNDPPTAVDDVYATPESRRLDVPGPGILGNDVDPDQGDTLSAVLVNPPRHGTLSLRSDGSFTYTPESLFAGTDEFTYRATDGAAQSGVATVTIGISGIRTTLAELDPASDTGVSATDRITRDHAPVFLGTAQPGLGLTLLAQMAGSSVMTPVATTTADAAGNFRLASSILGDGAYEFFVAGERPDGLATGTVSAGTLLIDTVAPVITGAVLVPKAGQIQVVFADDRSGLAAGTLADRGNYRVARRFGPTPANAGPNEVRVLPAATPGGPQAVAVKIYNGRRVPRGRLMLAVLSGGVTDVAGNPLAGLFTGSFPTIPPAGTNFLGEFHVRNRKPTPAENTAARFPIALPEPAATTVASILAEPLPSTARHHRWHKTPKKTHR